MPPDATPRHAPNYHPLVRSVARGLRRRCKVPADANILVAVSGGADSVALLRALAILAPRRKFNLTLTVAHINHHLRGEASDTDAVFVQTLANQLSLPCHITGVHLDAADNSAGGSASGGSTSGGNVEAAARDARYDALAITAQHCGASYIATAHHADDQLETLLMRFIRGASVQGLRGIASARPLEHDHSSLDITLVRPMLDADRDTARAFLGMLGQRWREDTTNTDTARVRNRLRHEVIPLIKDIRNDVTTRAVNLADHFADLHDLVQETSQATQSPPNEIEVGVPDSPSHQSPTPIPRDEARQLNPLILTQQLRQQLIQSGAPPDQVPGHALRPVLDAINDNDGSTRTFEFANLTTITLTRELISIQGPATNNEA
ncbi:tRNA lysidine(34) synthetase TilS [Phycisphaeraceae bacterium D3-23]